MQGIILPRRCRLRRRSSLAPLVLLGGFLAGCTDSPTAARFRAGDGPSDVTAVTLPPIEVTACQYGGFYPDCKDPLPSGGSVSPMSRLPPAGPQSGGGTSGTPPPDTTPCRTNMRMLDDSVTQAAFRTIWAKSNYAPTVDMAQRSEHGGWLIQDPATNVYRFQLFPEEWSRSCEIDIPAGTVPPSNTVALLHSHPFHRGELLTACPGLVTPTRVIPVGYRNDTSFSDDSTVMAINRSAASGAMVGLMIDADSVTAFTSTASQIKVNRCGY